MSDRSAMHCHLHGDYRCRHCFSVDGWDRSIQYVQQIEAQLAETRGALGALIDDCAAWDEAVEAIIGRQPRSGWLDKYRKALAGQEGSDE